MAFALEVENLNKEFHAVKAVDDLSIKLEENKIYGLLGRNGAGKTTFLKLIVSQYVKDSGSIKAFGEETFENENALSKICFVNDEEMFSPYLKVKDIFKMAKLFYKNWDENYKEILLSKFELHENQKYGELSKGNRACVGIILALSSRAEITIYDESYSGLDEVAREIFYDELLKDYSENPRTIIFSTHFISEVNKIFESVIMIDKGKVKLFEDCDELREKSIMLMGEKDKLEEYLKKVNVIHKEEIGGILRAAVFEKLTKDEKNKLKDMGIEVNYLPMEKLFVYMTKGGN
ncbi:MULTISPECIES: ATP-binding cassette domain-containing protein [Clostridium]|uniref:ATP-binding cassette domain-containing protein n=1 Tax=Clostridium TaxID=1485 RepID=UPI00082549CF|nr:MULTISPECIES: ABC transporter ATP-binding protein [Clostridium]PJI08555.1 ABC transporter ATP-binding protein [Clostridium sp. CT7]